MRILDSLKIEYEMQTYECETFEDGIHVADLLGISHEIMYKTIVLIGKSRNYYIFVIPIECEIDFKKAAKIVNEKSMELLPLKDLTKVTGYVRGGCTAIGMKKKFPTIIQEDIKNIQKVVVSGGRIGLQLILNSSDYINAVQGVCADIVRE